MEIAFALFPNLTQLDLTGPLQVLSRLPGATCRLVGADLTPLPTDTALVITPTDVFADAPQPDILCVPGGPGVLEALESAELLEYLRAAASGARYVTSVCTGALLLGAAGLLRGKRATTHWAYTELLSKFGAIYEKARVIRDGNIVTGGGVTAGVDFAFTLAAEIAGDTVAQSIQLALEYAPAPPFAGVSPEAAPDEVMGVVSGFYGDRVARFRDAIERLSISDN